MVFHRVLPPAAAPLYPSDIVQGVAALAGGDKAVIRFQTELKEFYNKKYCFLVSSGKAALTITLQSLQKIYPNRDQVLIPAFTCYSVPSAIVRAGLKVRLCDNDPDTLDFDFRQMSTKIAASPPPETDNKHPATEGIIDPARLLAVIPAHMFGLPADIGRLRHIVQSEQITIIEDAAQAMGGARNGQKIGTLGDVSFFSLGRGKSLSTVEGGVILTDSDEIAQGIQSVLATVRKYTLGEQIKLLLNAFFLTIFQRPSLFWLPKSLPFLRLGETIYDPAFTIRKLSSFQAGLAWNWQAKLTDFISSRASHTRFWGSSLPQSIVNEFISGKTVPALIRYPVFINNQETKKKILQKSEAEGLGIMLTYPAPINKIKELENVFADQEFSVADRLTKNIITLPIHPFVTKKDRSRLHQLLHETLNSS